jgi:hypothetical protein
MNPDIAVRWVTALRSGEYVQGKSYLRVGNQLRDEDKFCCLGVLCELAVADNVIDPPEEVNGIFYYGHAAKMPPEKVTDWAGMEPNQTIRYNGEVHSLASLNDIGVPFDTIAAFIEQQVATL